MAITTLSRMRDSGMGPHYVSQRSIAVVADHEIQSVLKLHRRTGAVVPSAGRERDPVPVFFGDNGCDAIRRVHPVEWPRLRNPTSNSRPSTRARFSFSSIVSCRKPSTRFGASVRPLGSNTSPMSPRLGELVGRTVTWARQTHDVRRLVDDDPHRCSESASPMAR